MAKDLTRSWLSPAAVLLVVCAAVLGAGCSGPKGALEQISVTQYRYNVDEDNNVVRVIGRARNGGEERTPEGEIVITLHGRTGSLKGSNRTELPSLEAGEEHRFSLAITSHGKVESVDIAIVPPGTASADEAAEADDEAGGVGDTPSKSAAEEGG